MEKEKNENYGNHIVQYSPEYSLCAGCESCSILCGLMHDGFTGPNNGRIKVNLGTRSMMHEILSCAHCKDHPCYDACPKKGQAMVLDEERNIVSINPEFCIGCGLCIKKCALDPPRISLIKDNDRKKWKAAKCDLCKDRPEGPMCIQYCPVRCIGLSDNSVFKDGSWFPKETEPTQE